MAGKRRNSGTIKESSFISGSGSRESLRTMFRESFIISI